MKKLQRCFILLLFFVLLLSPLPASAADEDSDLTDTEVSEELTTTGRTKLDIKEAYGAVDLQAHIADILKLSVPGKQSSTKNAGIEADSRTAKMFASLMSNSWQITRVLVFGLTGLDETVNLLANDESLKQELARRTQLQKLEMGGKWGGPNRDGLNVEPIDYEFGGLDHKTMQVIKDRKNIVEGINELKGIPGFTSNNSVYDRVARLSILLLTLFLAIRMINLIFNRILGVAQEQSVAEELFECFLRYIIFIAFVLLVKWGIVALMMFSDMTRNVIIGASTNGGIEQIAEHMSTMTRVRGTLAKMGAGESLSIVNMANTGFDLTSMIRSSVSYLCYVMTGSIVYVMVILGDIMMGISAVLAPLILSISMIKAFSGWANNLFTSLVKYSLYLPIAAIYMLTMCMIQLLSPTTGFFSFFIISIAFLFGATKIPALADALSGAAGVALISGFLGKVVSYQLMAAKRGIGAAIGIFRK